MIMKIPYQRKGSSQVVQKHKLLHSCNICHLFADIEDFDEDKCDKCDADIHVDG